MSAFQTISVQELAKRSEQGEVDLIDVRTPVEFRSVRAALAKNHPLDALDPHGVMKSRSRSADESLYFICKSGGRSARACQQFVDAGYSDVISIDGGTEAWVGAGLPAVQGKKAVSLERQVRIAAGSIVLVGSLLGLFVHPFWLGVPAFVGAGLVFAGITDTCGMGMLIAKMPWNQTKGDTCDTCCS